ncbi:MAG: hypothetical protein WD872_02580 [Pirellulaceae bacterium]
MTSLLKFNIAVRGTDAHSGLTAVFDAAYANLERLPRLFIEPDGSFVWRGTSDDGLEWQVDGNLIDRGVVLDYVELKGNCPAERFDDLLRALGWPASPVRVQLPRRGVFLTEEEFRRQAARPEGAG